MIKLEIGKLYEISFLPWQTIHAPVISIFESISGYKKVGDLELHQYFLFLEESKIANNKIISDDWCHIKILTNTGIIGYIFFEHSKIIIKKYELQNNYR